MILSGLDWVIILLSAAVYLAVGLFYFRRAGQDADSFFLSGRNMPWWMLGISMVATTFSADTPNLVTDIVRQHGVSGNWVWWAFLLTGMVTVFIFAAMWRRSGVFTDLEFYELRYSGKPAAVLRGFRALYLGVFFNIMIMATVSLAAIKIGSVLFGFSPLKTLFLASLVTVVYSSMSGLKGVIMTDCLQFLVAMVGTVAAAMYILDLPEIGGLHGLITNPKVQPSLSLLPDFNNPAIWVPMFLMPLAVQWWSVWYPGSEPGGGGYIAQRMLAAKDENHSVAATFLFNVAHYALRPWPWIIIALASLVLFPDLESLKAGLPQVDSSLLGHDLAYPAMVRLLPSGLLGLVVAALMAAYMSTISTHLNWGASYIVHDFYHRFVKSNASEKELVKVGRIVTVILMLASALMALVLQNALQAFQILLQIGAGTGLIFILRWFWWRVNAWSEITAMVVSFLIAIFFEVLFPGLWPSHWEMLFGVGVTTFAWIAVAFLTPPADEKTLLQFVEKVRPWGPGWKRISGIAPEKGVMPRAILGVFGGVMVVYGALFATGNWIYGRLSLALCMGLLCLVGVGLLIRMLRKP